MYFLDPRTGRRRRAVLRDKLVHAFALERSLLGKARRDLEHRAQGVVGRLRTGQRREGSDPVLAERVRAAIGRLVSHAAALEVTARDGVVTLRGPVLEDEVQRVCAHVASVTGVCGVVDELERQRLGSHRAPARLRRGALMPGPRTVVGGAGVALVASRHSAAQLAGVALLARALANRPLAQVFGLAPTWVELAKTLAIDAPIERVFAVWSRVDGFARFMEHVRSVRATATERASRWVVDGPFGGTVAFEARVTRFEHNREIAWETLPGSGIQHAGVVHFERVGDGTRIHIHMRYQPPGGLVGHALARLIGCDPKSRLDEDLVRAKALLERGHTRAHHHRVDVDEIVPRYS